ncbi:TIGR00730 family Rossman fold protein, partial [Mesorhizobium sp. M00.F.Ca.ET.149.01.1.1]
VKPLVVKDPEAIGGAIMVAGSSVDAPTEGVRAVIDKM